METPMNLIVRTAATVLTGGELASVLERALIFGIEPEERYAYVSCGGKVDPNAVGDAWFLDAETHAARLVSNYPIFAFSIPPYFHLFQRVRGKIAGLSFVDRGSSIYAAQNIIFVDQNNLKSCLSRPLANPRDDGFDEAIEKELEGQGWVNLVAGLYVLRQWFKDSDLIPAHMVRITSEAVELGSLTVEADYLGK